MSKARAKRGAQSTKPAYREYEILSAEVIRQYSPDSFVLHDDKIRGISGRVRQIDVSVRPRQPEKETFMAVECKLYKRRVGIKQVDSMIGQILDVGADVGLIVSDSGFDGGARARAKADGRIQLRHLVHSDMSQLRSRLVLPLCMRYVDLLPTYRVSMASLMPLSVPGAAARRELAPEDHAALFHQFYSTRGLEVFSSFESWANERITTLPDGENYCCVDGYLTPELGVRTEFRFDKRTDMFRGAVPMPARGLVDPDTNQLTLGSFGYFSFQPDPDTIRDTWARVNARVKPSGIILEGRRGLRSDVAASVAQLLQQIPGIVGAS